MLLRDRTGERVGRLLVLEYVDAGRPGFGATWKCLCDCGKEKLVTSNYLNRYPHTKNISCGCGRFYKWNNNERGTINSAWAQFKCQAKKRGLKMTITFEQWLNLSQRPCHYCGVERSNTHKRISKLGVDFLYNGIDRKDSAKGYVFKNCVTCCRTCNMAKRLMDEKEFIEWVDRVYSYTKNKLAAYTGI